VNPPYPPASADPQHPKVLIANGNGTAGTATSAIARLCAAPFVIAPAADADRSDYATSMLYYRPGHEQEALAVALALGVGADQATPMLAAMPEVPPVRGTNGQANAALVDVILVMGQDRVFETR
jgi:hypothetical protein